MYIVLKDRDYPLTCRFGCILAWWVFLLARGIFLVHALSLVYTLYNMKLFNIYILLSGLI
jgi:hypothetical protein